MENGWKSEIKKKSYLYFRMKYKIAIAGSTHNTIKMAEAIATDSRFEVSFTISPKPKLIGRKQISTKNPLHLWSEKNQVKNFLVDQKIEKSLLEELIAAGEIDFLLVVDFGYLIPKWLLRLPKIAPLNIHPSLLPKWRGSSPGQFCLLFQNLGEFGDESAVTLMIMSEGLDEGPIITQLPFKVDSDWTQLEYYEHAFTLIGKELTNLISNFAKSEIQAQAQPSESPTMIARRLSKDDSFISWKNLEKLINGQKINVEEIFPKLLGENSIQQLFDDKLSQIKLVVNASKAFYPWPNLWTIIPTNSGERRMKILSCHLEKECLILDQIQIEGKNPSKWNESKNTLA